MFGQRGGGNCLYYYSVPSSLDRIYSEGRRALILENCIGLPDRILDVGDAG